MRYSRQIILPELGLDGQSKIRAAKILCVGAGGLGSPAALYLAAAGVGTLGVADFDVVDISNLQRQILHSTSSVGQPKTESASQRLRDLNPNIEVIALSERVSSGNALEILSPFDAVIDGSDNFPTRYLINDACVLSGKPCIYGSVFRFEGQAGILAPRLGGPCYRCLYPEPPPLGAAPNCAEAGVLGVLPGLIGVIQATEALKLVAGIGKPLLGRLLLVDALEMSFRSIRVKRDPACPICGTAPSITKLADSQNLCDSQNTHSMHPDEVTVLDMKQALDDPSLGIKVIDVREPDEYQIARIEGVPLIPLGTLPMRLSEFVKGQEYYLHCKAGARSLKAVELLKAAGITKVKSVKGGIQAWSKEVDPSVPLY